jgi:S1/P1 nuclease
VRLRALAFALALVLCAGPARAWDDFAHMEIAALAWGKLTPETRTRVSSLLERNPSYPNWIVGAKAADRPRVAFMRAATWADAIKNDSHFDDDSQDATTAPQNLGYGDLLRHKYWHFVDQPFSPDNTPTVAAPAPNVVTQIAVFRAALASHDANDDVKSYDLSWLLHLVGDAHQPLHCVSRFDQADPKGDRGGNTVRITGNEPPPICEDPRFCPFGPPGNLHAFWDDLVGSSYGIAAASAAAAQLPDAPESKAAIADEKVWAQEGLDLAQKSIYVKPIGIGRGPFAVTKDYQQKSHVLAKKRIALAAARLANLLNDAIAKEAAQEP